MTYYYDTFGWLSDTPVTGRETDIAPPAFKPPMRPNFTGHVWIVQEYRPFVPEMPDVPETITPRQCRLQLLAEEKLDDVEAAIGTMGQEAKIEWEYALEVKRTYPLVLAMMQLFQWTDADADTFFVEAGKL